MITYIVENKDKEIIAIVDTLKRAKDALKTLKGYRILMMRGQYFGEGYHQYELIYDETKDKFTRHYL